jgi:hypothetical protein
MPGMWQVVRTLLSALVEGRQVGPHVAARARSMRLLETSLSPAQHQQWLRYRYFDVIGGDTGRCYRIHKGCTTNVALLNGSGGLVRYLCFEPRGALPVGDVILAQKLALELFETSALSVANKSADWQSYRSL